MEQKIVRVKEMVRYIKKIADDKKIESSDVLHLTVKLMEFVKKYPGLTGKEKKELVKNALAGYLEQAEIEGKDRLIVQVISENVIPKAIDLIVAASKGKFKFKHVKKMFSCC